MKQQRKKKNPANRPKERKKKERTFPKPEQGTETENTSAEQQKARDKV